MKVNQIITEVERLTPGDYEGGKDSLRGSEAKKLKKLPGGSGLMYQVDRRYGCKIELVAKNVQTDRPYNHRPWDNASTVRHATALKKWEANSTGNKVIGRLDLSKVNDFPMPNTYHVSIITVDEDYRGRGLAKALYGIAISELHMNLISGDSQTPGGRQNWVSLAKIPGCEVVGLLSIHDHHIPNGQTGYYKPDDSVVNNLMTIGCDYIGAKGKKHWFYFPIKLSKNELAAAIKHNVKVYHDNYKSGGDWETFLLARWVG
jgi:GNAT superfamily N-acetyltransferase